jgi:hypothetical protein
MRMFDTIVPDLKIRNILTTFLGVDLTVLEDLQTKDMDSKCNYYRLGDDLRLTPVDDHPGNDGNVKTGPYYRAINDGNFTSTISSSTTPLVLLQFKNSRLTAALHAIEYSNTFNPAMGEEQMIIFEENGVLSLVSSSQRSAIFIETRHEMMYAVHRSIQY